MPGTHPPAMIAATRSNDRLIEAPLLHTRLQVVIRIVVLSRLA
jgi:hypothetical protein